MEPFDAERLRKAKLILESRELVTSHLGFTRRMFVAAEGTPFIVGPHHKLICDQLDRVIRGECTRLGIHIPPGYSKTELAVINFVARGFAVNPKARFIHTSFSQELVNDNSSRIKDLINLPQYQDRWPLGFKSDTNSKGLWRTEQRGHFLAKPAGGPITGFRAGYLNKNNLPEDMSELDEYELEFLNDDAVFTGALIIDDPLKPDDALSDPERKSVNRRWQNTMRSRLAHENVPVILIMQRLHVDDFAAHVYETSGEEWEVISIPIEIDGEAEPVAPKVKVVPHGLPDGPLWPVKHDQAQIDILKLDEHTFAGQYMQQPVVLGGNMFKATYFDWFDEEKRPDLKRRIICADTASKTKERNDYSVFGCFGLDRNDRLYLLDLVRGKWEAPELVQIAENFWLKHKELPWNVHGHLNSINVEDASSGTGLIQQLQRKRLPVVGVQVETDKVTKALGVIPSIAVNPVLLPKDAPWAKDFLNEMYAFPEGVFDDQCDVLMMGVNELLEKAHSIFDSL
ncbi:MAG: phage terminase large subunit [Nitratireductor sp.]|nr:phage terminase large subunit [Nitratireductor sp.]